MILHTINKSPFSNSSFTECLRLCTSGNSILFIEDGVYAAKDNTEFSQLIEAYPEINFYALSADVEARGLTDLLNKHVKITDDTGFVKLCTQHKSVQSWY